MIVAIICNGMGDIWILLQVEVVYVIALTKNL